MQVSGSIIFQEASKRSFLAKPKLHESPGPLTSYFRNVAYDL